MNEQVREIYSYMLKGYKLKYKNITKCIWWGTDHGTRELTVYGRYNEDSIVNKYGAAKDPEIHRPEKRLDEAFELIAQLKVRVGENVR
jgi:hypothetical protein